MKFDEYVKINNLMFEYDELINNYCRKNQYSEEIINLAVNVADDIFEKHGFRAVVLDASDIHTAPVMFNLIVTKIHASMKRI